MSKLDDLYEYIAQSRPRKNRPVVTLTYAQSLDGSIATAGSGSGPLALCGPESMQMTHHLRALHDGILVGIGTVLADDPSLTVRLAPGDHPQPLVLDTDLRFPPTAALLSHPKSVWVCAGPDADAKKQGVIEQLGGRVLRLRTRSDGRVSLTALLERLHSLGIQRLMVEGGAQVITAFLEKRIPDQIVITISPHLVGGLHAVESLDAKGDEPVYRLDSPQWTQLGDDLAVWNRAV